ncbi:hypothetical protein PSMK_09860 [Phycisphaera mikurensis NBRC 102666]|uniref:Uncharacterized protein n=1 Tax=Phycisphaera mikurensis (strain NBRC 102666 / KCTC 22515 / FYK2301M01) TaxID=1142394 RepID=I0ID07_PHYMF|nr:hypothetical protein PSMK_09860 [Phycisphaera mikurensis NBRC 102666]
MQRRCASGVGVALKLFVSAGVYIHGVDEPPVNQVAHALRACGC